MYRVSLVDDEEWSLLGIEKSFNWRKYGFEVISSDTDPEEALHRIIEIRPDAIFTDIRMPQISGLDLITRVQAAGLDSIFIIISGFAEFDYAKEALKLGAFEYCLKPVDIKETDRLLIRLAQHLSRKEESRGDSVFKKLREGDELIAKSICEICEKQKTEEFYQTLAISNYDAEALERFLILCPGKAVYTLSHGDCTLFVFSTKSDLSPYVENFYGNSNCKLADIGLSPPFRQEIDIPQKLLEAHIASKSNFILNRHGIFSCRKNIEYNFTKDFEKLLYKSNSPAYMSKEAIIESLNNLTRMDKSRLYLDDVVLFWNSTVSFLRLNYNNLNEAKISFFDYDELTSRFEDVNEMSNYLKTIISELQSGAKSPLAVNGVNSNFKKLLAFLEEHYTENLSLQGLAEQFFINTAYCCQLFSRLAGMNFSSYITMLRMKKARVLLETADLSIDEICVESGYNDYFYFNKVFKKYYGVTPSKFRKNKTI